jgi:hypothetical protein
MQQRLQLLLLLPLGHAPLPPPRPPTAWGLLLLLQPPAVLNQSHLLTAHQHLLLRLLGTLAKLAYTVFLPPSHLLLLWLLLLLLLLLLGFQKRVTDLPTHPQRTLLLLHCPLRLLSHQHQQQQRAGLPACLKLLRWLLGLLLLLLLIL